MGPLILLAVWLLALGYALVWSGVTQKPVREALFGAPQSA